jgi:cytochrome P450
MFVFLFAGHEVNYFPPSYGVVVKSSLQTTAHTLCFTFALLALYPDEQERLYQHIKGVMSSLNGMPVRSRNPNLYRELISHRPTKT